MKLNLSEKSQFLKNFGESQCHQNVFSRDEIVEISNYMFRNTPRWRVSNTGNLFFSGNLEPIVARFFDTFSKFIDLTGVSEISGNFFHTPHQYGFHTDMPEETDESFIEGDVPYKSILIPLYLLPSSSNCHFLLFKERYVSFGASFDRGTSRSLTHYRSISCYDELTDLFDASGEPVEYLDGPFNKKVYDYYNLAETSPRERFGGFEIENVFQWCPGSMIVFDTTQLHCSNRGLPDRFFVTKAGLRLSLWKNYKGNRPEIDWTALCDSVKTHSLEGLIDINERKKLRDECPFESI